MTDAIRVHEDGDFETVSRLDYDNKLNHPFTAHPKVDPVTGSCYLVLDRKVKPPLAAFRTGRFLQFDSRIVTVWMLLTDVVKVGAPQGRCLRMGIKSKRFHM